MQLVEVDDYMYFNIYLFSLLRNGMALILMINYRRTFFSIQKLFVFIDLFILE
jgi:hypothetical protein